MIKNKDKPENVICIKSIIISKNIDGTLMTQFHSGLCYEVVESSNLEPLILKNHGNIVDCIITFQTLKSNFMSISEYRNKQIDIVLDTMIQ